MSFRRFFQRARWDQERATEIESYVEIETAENIARGMTPREAEARARRKFGNSTLVREEIYRMNGIAFLDGLARDTRYAIRTLFHAPVFTAVALLTLAIGISANTAVFSVVNSILLRPLNYPDPDQVVTLRQVAPGAAGLASFSEGLLLSPSMYFTYAEHNRTFQSLGAWITGTANVTGMAEPEQVRAIAVTDGVLQTLGVSPAFGRRLSASDQIPQSSGGIILGYGYWQRRFAGSASVIGRTLKVDERSREIVGVMPRGFRVGAADFDIMVPLAFDRSKAILAGFGFHGIGRLKRGVTLAQANADLARLLPIWMDSWSNGPGIDSRPFYKKWKIRPDIRPLKQEVVGNIGNVLWVVMATIGVVMLIACVNVANLLLVRTEARRQELAVRVALGAGRAQIARELLVESTILGLVGGAFGLALAYEALHVLVAIGPANLPRLEEILLDTRALGFALCISFLSGLLFGLMPAFRYAGSRVSVALRSSGRAASASRDNARVRNSLVVAQVAMALVLLVGASLMIRTFQALRTVKPGFTDPAHLQLVRITIPASLIKEPLRVLRTQNEILDKLAAIPQVRSAAFADQMPMEGFGHNWDNIYPEHQANPAETPPLRFFKYISPGYFRTAGTRMIAGHDLTWSDIYNQHPVGIVSEGLAREFWGSPSAAIGRHFRQYPMMPWHEVIGVAEDVRENGVHDNPPAIVYWPAMHSFAPNLFDATRFATFEIRSERAGTESFLNQVQQAVWSVNPELPAASIQTMQDVYSRSLARTSFTLLMLVIAGAMALLLGIVGIYGVISYSVSQRRREIGIRLALGAQRRELERMFVGSGLRLTLIGSAVGVVAATGLTQLMRSLLFGTGPLDPVTYCLVPLILATAAALASYLPARRAGAVDPVEALRAE